MANTNSPARGGNKPADNPFYSTAQIANFGNEAFDQKVAGVVDRGLASDDEAVRSYTSAFNAQTLRSVDCRDLWKVIKQVEATENDGAKDQPFRDQVHDIRGDLDANLKFRDDMKAFKGKEPAERKAYAEALISALKAAGRLVSITTLNQVTAKAASLKEIKAIYAAAAKEGLRADAVSMTIILKAAMAENNLKTADQIISKLENMNLDDRGQKILDYYKKLRVEDTGGAAKAAE